MHVLDVLDRLLSTVYFRQTLHYYFRILYTCKNSSKNTQFLYDTPRTTPVVKITAYR